MQVYIAIVSDRFVHISAVMLNLLNELRKIDKMHFITFSQGV